MKVTNFNSACKITPIVLCLGWFDSIHKGHKKIINSAKILCEKTNANLAVLTFLTDENCMILKKMQQVFEFDERVILLEKQGVNEVICVNFNQEFANKNPVEFLDELCDNRLIAGFVCGKDYKFGKNAEGDINLLINYCKQKKLSFEIIDFETDETGDKISTNKIKNLLLSGNVKKVNQLLQGEFFVSGEVVQGRKQGRTLGFPTANIILSENKIKFKRGVYSTVTEVDGVLYKSFTNYGSAPTFDFCKDIIETHLLNFSGDLYGKKITVYFKDFIREIIKFESKQQLIEQLQNDLKVIK